MKRSIQSIIHTLKQSRISRQIRQSALAAQAHMPQSHLSKVEAGDVDIQISSLIELSRLLDLEVMLVPRQKVSLVKALIVSSGEDEKNENQPAYALDEEDENGKN